MKYEKGSFLMIIKIQSVVFLTSIALIIAIIFVISLSIQTPLSFLQSDMSNSTNQTVKNMSQSANQTVEPPNKMLIKLVRQFREMLIMVTLTSLKKHRILEKI